MGIFDGLWANPAALSPLETATMAAVLAAEQARQAEQAAAWDAYHGVFPQPLPPAADGVDDAITINRMRTVVDTATDFLFGTLPTWNLPPRADAPAAVPAAVAAPETETPDEVWLTDCLRLGNLPMACLALRTQGGVTGDGYLRLTAPDPATGYPGFQVQDSTAWTMRWNPRDLSDVTAYHWQATMPGPDGKPRLERQRIERAADGQSWIITDEHASLRTKELWTVDQTTVWPHPFAPILHVPNLPIPNEVYGGPDITPNLIHLNGNLNTNLTNRNRVERYQGHPILYATGVGPNTNLDIRPDKLNKLPGEQSRLDQLAPKLDMTAAQQLAKEINDALDEESRTPAITRGRSEVGNPSGVALRIQFWPMDAKVRALRLTYGPALVELFRRLLALGGKGDTRIVTLTWPRILPTNMLEHRQALLIEQQMGTTSRSTIADELGRNWEDEQANLKTEATLAPPPAAGQPQANLATKADTSHPPPAG